MSYRRNLKEWQVTSLYTINKAIEERRSLANNMILSDSETLRRKAIKTVPARYHEYLDIFSKHESD